MKVSELSGSLLARWVALAAGYNVVEYGDHEPITWVDNSERCLGHLSYGEGGLYWQPQADWSQGGPIIERENLAILRTPLSDGSLAEWEAGPSSTIEGSWDGWMRGQTPLIATMRAFVASKYGENLPDEEVA